MEAEELGKDGRCWLTPKNLELKDGRHWLTPKELEIVDGRAPRTKVAVGLDEHGIQVDKHGSGNKAA